MPDFSICISNSKITRMENFLESFYEKSGDTFAIKEFSNYDYEKV